MISLGNAILYEVLFWLLDHGHEKRIWGLQFENSFWFIGVFTLIATFVTYFAGWLINYAYFQQGSAHGSDSRFPQFLMWFSSYATYILLSYFQRNETLDRQTLLALLLILAAMIVRYWGK